MVRFYYSNTGLQFSDVVTSCYAQIFFFVIEAGKTQNLKHNYLLKMAAVKTRLFKADDGPHCQELMSVDLAIEQRF